MKLIRCLCTTLALAALPLAADPLSFVVLDGTTPGALLRYSEHGVTTIATLAAGGVARSPEHQRMAGKLLKPKIDQSPNDDIRTDPFWGYVDLAVPPARFPTPPVDR